MPGQFAGVGRYCGVVFCVMSHAFQAPQAVPFDQAPASGYLRGWQQARAVSLHLMKGGGCSM